MNLTLSRLWRRPPSDNPGVDYRDRISVATWVVVFGLGVSLLLEIPTTQITFRALGSPITLSLSAGNVMALLLAVAAAAGTESIVRLHPHFPRRHRSATWAYWALPMAIASITVVLLPQVPTRLLQVIVMLAAGGLLAIAFYSLYATVEPGQPGFRRARFALDALSYGAALLLGGGVLRRPLVIAAIAASVVALAGDYLETFTLLKLTHALDAPNALLPTLELGAWSKFAALAVHALACAGLCFTGEKRRNILGVLLVLPTLGLAAAAYDHVTLANAMNAGFAIAWIALLIVAVMSALRRAPEAAA